jgi:3-oxoacyl-[acyl-carrier protein] reductase
MEDAGRAAKTARVAVVTGAAVGIGAAAARRLSRDGLTCVLVDRSPEVERVATEIADDTGTATLAVVVDLTDEAQIVAMVKSVEQRLGRIDVLVNNAGVSPKRAGG